MPAGKRPSASRSGNAIGFDSLEGVCGRLDHRRLEHPAAHVSEYVAGNPHFWRWKAQPLEALRGCFLQPPESWPFPPTTRSDVSTILPDGTAPPRDLQLCGAAESFHVLPQLFQRFLEIIRDDEESLQASGLGDPGDRRSGPGLTLRDGRHRLRPGHGLVVLGDDQQIARRKLIARARRGWSGLPEG